MARHKKVLAIGFRKDDSIPNVDFIRGDVFSILTINLQKLYGAVLLNPSSAYFMRFKLDGSLHKCQNYIKEDNYFNANKDGVCKLLLHRKYASQKCINIYYETGLQSLATKHASLIINKLYLSMTTGTNVVIFNNPRAPDHYLCRFHPEKPLPYLGKSRQIKCEEEHPIFDAFKGLYMSKTGTIIYSEQLPAVSTIRDLLLRDQKELDRFGPDLSGYYYGLEQTLSQHVVLKAAYTNLVKQATAIIGFPENSDGCLLILPRQTNMSPVIRSISETISKIYSEKKPLNNLVPEHQAKKKSSAKAGKNAKSIPQDDPATISSIESQPLTTSRPSTSIKNHSEKDVTAKDHPSYASWYKKKRDFMDFFIPLADADLHSESPKTWRDLAEEASTNAKGHGLIMPTTQQQLRRYLIPELKTWYKQKIDWENGDGPHPTELF